MNTSTNTFDIYSEQAETLAEKYESRSFAEIHAGIVDLLPAAPGRILDIGAGSGRDAAWFADHRYQVTAVEPARRLREAAQSRHPQQGITWLDDRLPDLSNVFQLGKQFNLVWMSAVWMHVLPASRQTAFANIVSLLHPGGRVMISLREGPFPKDRVMYATSLDEIEALANEDDLSILCVKKTGDKLQRSDVSWQSVMLQLPK
ncbi:MAG: class I SAM-dependent methyltransferase [Gammaproteobacteria bacterium]|nr:class I SAM-dependent methyltransferase [Gammaproteobacteria bacterium]